MAEEFKTPRNARDRYRNLSALVHIIEETGEDPLVIAHSAGVSPYALIRALPADLLSRLVPSGTEGLSTADIMLKLAGNHALDVAVESIVDPTLDVKTRVTMARDLMDRTSLVGQKQRPTQSVLTISDDSLSKLAQLERQFTNMTIPDEYSTFHKTGGKHEGEDENADEKAEAWTGPKMPDIRDLDHDSFIPDSVALAQTRKF
jgi:hypothetical protein